MKFCQKCGHAINSNARFCSECGTPSIEFSYNENSIESKYDNKVIKCPNCGETINSYTAFCPSCACELKELTVSNAFKNFMNEMNSCDNEFMKYKSVLGWSYWSTGKKILMVFLAIYTCGISVIIDWNIRKNKREKMPLLKNKEAIIENFPFPNDRETIIEAMIYIECKISQLEQETTNENCIHFANIWYSKFEQLYSKSKILFPNDKDINDIYISVSTKIKSLKKKYKKRKIIVYPAVTVLFLLSLIPLILNIRSSNTTDVNKLNWPSSGLSMLLPTPKTNYGKFLCDSSDYIIFELYDMSENDYIEYINSCKEKGFDKSNNLSLGKNYTAYDDNDNYISLTYFSSENNGKILITLYSSDYKNDSKKSTNSKISANGYENESQNYFEYENIMFSMPFYFESEPAENSTDTTKYFYSQIENKATTMLGITKTESNIKKQNFNSDYKNFMNGFLKSFNSVTITKEDTTTFISDNCNLLYFSSNINDIDFDSIVCTYFDYDNNQIITISIFQEESSLFDYTEDFLKLLEYAKK